MVHSAKGYDEGKAMSKKKMNKGLISTRKRGIFVGEQVKRESKAWLL